MGKNPSWYRGYMDDEEIKAWKLLDTIDLFPYLNKRKNEDLWKAMDDIGKDYADIFDAISEYDFSEYINDMYGRYSVNSPEVFIIDGRFEERKK